MDKNKIERDVLEKLIWSVNANFSNDSMVEEILKIEDSDRRYLLFKLLMSMVNLCRELKKSDTTKKLTQDQEVDFSHFMQHMHLVFLDPVYNSLWTVISSLREDKISSSEAVSSLIEIYNKMSLDIFGKKKNQLNLEKEDMPSSSDTPSLDKLLTRVRILEREVEQLKQHLDTNFD